MGLKECTYGFFGGAIVGGAVYAGLGAASGAAGAVILKASHYDGYDVKEATEMGAIGSAILGGGANAIGGALWSCGLFKNNSDKDNGSHILALISYVGSQVLGGLTGYGVMNAMHATDMNIGQTAAALAVGGAVTLIPAIIVLLCILMPIAFCIQKNAEQSTTRVNVFRHDCPA